MEALSPKYFSKGYALIEYSTLPEAKAVIKTLNGPKLLDPTIQVDFAFVRPPPSGKGKSGGGGNRARGGRGRSRSRERSRSPGGKADRDWYRLSRYWRDGAPEVTGHSRNRILSYICHCSGTHGKSKIPVTLFMTSRGCWRKAEAKRMLVNADFTSPYWDPRAVTHPLPSSRDAQRRLPALGELNE